MPNSPAQTTLGAAVSTASAPAPAEPKQLPPASASAATGSFQAAPQAITVQMLPPKKEESLSDFALAWSTPLIALIAALITLQQWFTARQAHRLSMFDRRWAVYKGTKQFVAEPVLRGSISDEVLRSFLVATEGAAWLFDEGMGTFLRELYNKGIKFQELTTLTQGKFYATDAERQQERDEAANLKTWFNDQLNGLDRRFRPFMHVKH